MDLLIIKKFLRMHFNSTYTNEVAKKIRKEGLKLEDETFELFSRGMLKEIANLQRKTILEVLKYEGLDKLFLDGIESTF